MLSLPNLSIVSQYHRVGAISLEEGLIRIKLANTNGLRFQTIFGVRAAFGGNRLATFLLGTACPRCFRRGSYFAIERCKDVLINAYHVNLWGVTDTGQHFLMTSDHIMPKSKGGHDTLQNRQPMCSACNSKKGSLTPQQLLRKDVRQLIREAKKNASNFQQSNGTVL